MGKYFPLFQKSVQAVFNFDKYFQFSSIYSISSYSVALYNHITHIINQWNSTKLLFMMIHCSRMYYLRTKIMVGRSVLVICWYAFWCIIDYLSHSTIYGIYFMRVRRYIWFQDSR